MIDLKNPREYCENFLKIRDKKSRLVPLKLNPAQERLYAIIREEHDAGRPVRLVILKGRQMGCSTAIEGLYFADTATAENVFTLIIAHVEDATAHLFGMNKLFYDELPDAIKPMLKASNAQELVFENPTKDPVLKEREPGLRSRIRCVTAGSRGVGRSFTLRNVHCSEGAFWPKFAENMLGIMQAVPDEADTCVIVESTPNGFNEFKTFWDDAVAERNGFRPVFLAWYVNPEYQRDVPPGTEWTEEERMMMRDYGLTPEQMAWRRWCIRTNCGGDAQKFRQEYPTSADEAFLFSGRPYFDNDAVARMRHIAPEPEHIGFFEYDEEPDGRPVHIRWHEERTSGFVRIWDIPEDGHPYVAGGDTAGDGSDCFTAYLIDNASGLQAAEIQHQFSEILYAKQMYCLGAYYNWAMLAIETNYSTYPEMKLEEWNYPNLYHRQRFDTKRKQFVDALGWVTNQKTRPVALATLHSVMEESPESVRSFWTLGEMLTFAYDDEYRPAAAEGEHDDLVLAAAICHAARGQMRYTVAEEPAQKQEKLITKLEHAQRRKRRY